MLISAVDRHWLVGAYLSSGQYGLLGAYLTNGKPWTGKVNFNSG
jgi:hypothetical protein